MGGVEPGKAQAPRRLDISDRTVDDETNRSLSIKTKKVSNNGQLVVISIQEARQEGYNISNMAC